ncbi:MAG: VWA domain-containing protein, partial [Bryobacterales bacterium]|nr:VWA domain-containing protein [Bryobacteraceae bacterium]MDW8132026.1 VWA domain-containing protein [Bryobacterales bacterium]
MRAAWQARQLGVAIDTFALAGRPRPQLRLDSVSMPAQAFAGERFPLDLAVHSPRPAEAEVEIFAGGKSLGLERVALAEGQNLVRVHARLDVAGAVDLTGAVRSPELGEVRFAHAVSIRRPRVLLVTQDPPGTEKHLVQALEAAQFAVELAPAVPGRLEEFQIVVLNNCDLEMLAPGRKQSLEEFVRRGGGLLVIAGENNVYVDKKGVEDPLDRALPAHVAPPRTPEGVAVVLVLDKSSSMEGRKIELARLAAVGVVEHLRPFDLIGILIFDNSFHWIVPIRKADDRTLLKRLISGVMADGGTQIAPALQEAYRRILPVRALYKHIVLLTDGISEEGDSMALARDAAVNRVTISTVGLGQDVNRSFLERLALLARGKAYFMADPSGLEQILVRDVMEHTGSTAVEKPIRPQLVKPAEILEGIALDAAPPLAGYVRFLARPTADLLLRADERDPLLVRWQYGLGRSAVFASDAKSRWAASWIGWEGFDRFWANLFRDLLPKAPEGEVAVRYERATGEVVAEYRLAPHIEA